MNLPQQYFWYIMGVPQKIDQFCYKFRIAFPGSHLHAILPLYNFFAAIKWRRQPTSKSLSTCSKVHK
jgi:hypothetical protein